MRFPRVSGSTLDGRHLPLPGSFEGDPTLLVVSFQWQQRSLVDPWRSVATRLADRYDEFEYYELLVVDWRSRVLVEEAQREDLPSAGGRERLLVLRVNKRQFRQSLGLLGEETVYALLVDDGHVVRQAAGFPASATVEGLWTLLDDWEQVRPRPGQTSSTAG
jgi:hypothetical protein